MKTISVATALIRTLAASMGAGCNAFEDEGQTKVKYFLKDPKSAEFRNIKKVTKKSDANSAPAFCGEVNSKNAYGGFTGFERYIVIDNLVILEKGGRVIYDVAKGDSSSERLARDTGLLLAKLTFDNFELQANNENLIAKGKTLEMGKVTAFEVAWRETCE